MSMYVPMAVKQRGMTMNKGDLVMNDYEHEDEYYALPIENKGLGIVIGFSCGGRRYKGMYEALDSPESIRDVVKVDVMWSTGIVTEELAPCLMVISRADW
jgi:hypothetical protein